jgi:hypothetical protein
MTENTIIDGKDGSPLESERFLPPLLERACQFLTDSRDVWCKPSALYYANLSLSALRAMYPEVSEQFASIQYQLAAFELGVKEAFIDRISNLDADTLIELLKLLSSQTVPDQQLIDSITNELIKHIQRQLAQQPWSIHFRRVAQALMVLQSTSGLSRELAMGWLQLIARSERREGGGWPAAMDGEVSVVATAQIIQALDAVDPIGSADIINRGVQYLETRVEKDGWRRLGNGDDVFAQANVLQVLANHSSSTIIDAGISSLKAAANQNGWGVAPHSSSTVEMTSMALLALAACGENRFVPYRTAHNRLVEVTIRAEKLEADLSQLKQGITRQIAQQSGAILADRDKWRSEAKQHERTIAELQQALHAAEREALEQYRGTRELAREFSRTQLPPRERFGMANGVAQIFELLFLGVALVCGVGINDGVVSMFGLQIDAKWISAPLGFPALLRLATTLPIFDKFIAQMAYFEAVYFGLCAILVVISFVGFVDSNSASVVAELFSIKVSNRVLFGLAAESLALAAVIRMYLIWRQRRQTRLIEFQVSTRDTGASLPSFVLDYFNIAMEIPGPVREELGFLLVSRIVDMPRDVGMVYAADILRRLDVRSGLRDRFLSWTGAFLSLDAASRRAVSEQINRLK